MDSLELLSNAMWLWKTDIQMPKGRSKHARDSIRGRLMRRPSVATNYQSAVDEIPSLNLFRDTLGDKTEFQVPPPRNRPRCNVRLT
jgi:hypothetical protein